MCLQPDCRVVTPLGDVILLVACRDPNPSHEQISVEVSVNEQNPPLPDAMRLDRVVRIDLSITARVDGVSPYARFLLKGDLKGGGDGGEWLESIQFVHAGTMLSIGAPDKIWMETYGGYHSLYDVAYERSGLSISFGELASGDAISCPLAIAYFSGSPGPDNDHWTWFGVGAVITS